MFVQSKDVKNIQFRQGFFYFVQHVYGICMYKYNDLLIQSQNGTSLKSFRHRQSHLFRTFNMVAVFCAVLSLLLLLLLLLWLWHVDG